MELDVRQALLNRQKVLEGKDATSSDQPSDVLEDKVEIIRKKLNQITDLSIIQSLLK